jgi:hypothetical protein
MVKIESWTLRTWNSLSNAITGQSYDELVQSKSEKSKKFVTASFSCYSIAALRVAVYLGVQSSLIG